MVGVTIDAAAAAVGPSGPASAHANAGAGGNGARSRASSRTRKNISSDDLAEMSRANKALTIVIKLGTSSIVSPSYPFLPHLHLLSSIVETVVHLRELGHRVVLCSSGAIGVGLRRMGLKERGKGLSHKQALAAIGQGRLIALWDNLFSQVDQPIAQILLTRNDISDRTRYLNAQNTFNELLTMGVVPIVNENDTVSVSEIKFGDNDTLSAISSAIVHADYLFLLTDVECLYTDNPRTNPSARPVPVVRDISAIKAQVSTTTLGTSLGTGGMTTKLIAADLATAAGVTTVVMHSEKVRDVFEVIKDGPGPSRGEEGMAPGEDGEGVRCTRFLRREVALKDRKWWIAHGLHAAGTVIIDEGAYKAIKRRESGNRVLPAGVVRLEGTFGASQAVRIVVRRRKSGAIPEASAQSSGAADGSETPQTPNAGMGGNAVPSRLDSSADLGSSSAAISTRSSFDEVPGGALHLSSSSIAHTRRSPLAESTSIPTLAVPVPPSSASSAGSGTGSVTGTRSGSTEPDTPTLQPAMSLSSSIASLDPLSSRFSVPNSPQPAGTGHGLGASISGIVDKLGLTSLTTGLAGVGAGKAEEDEWEEVEIGKGLALYNSTEMERLKGQKSSHIEQILGYCESEHVVDSITFW